MNESVKNFFTTTGIFKRMDLESSYNPESTGEDPGKANNVPVEEANVVETAEEVGPVEDALKESTIQPGPSECSNVGLVSDKLIVSCFPWVLILFHMLAQP